MFDDIQALEQEIEGFRNNILASQDLVTSIEKMIKVMKTQNDEYSRTYKDVLEELKRCVQLQKVESESQLNELKKQNETTINNAVEKLNSVQKEHIVKINEVESAINLNVEKMLKEMKTQSEDYSKSYNDVLLELKNYVQLQKVESEAQLNELKKQNEIIINNAVEKIASSQREYLANIDEVKFILKKNEDQLVLKYQQFTTKLESTNIDQIYSSVQDLKKSINFKFNLLISGVGVSILLTIVSLLLK